MSFDQIPFTAHMTNEKEWWDDGIANIADDLSSKDLAHLKEALGKIVAEAMRRGEMKAWEEAQKALKQADPGPYLLWLEAEDFIEAKLTELKK